MPSELDSVAQAICGLCAYDYVGPVGEGAFKQTYAAREGDTLHALKVYRPGSLSERIEREVAAMLQCDHPNIAKLRRVDTLVIEGYGPCLYSVEEFLGGGTLAHRLSQKLLTRDETMSIGDSLVSAIEHIAAKHLVHRDIKLENIMLRDDGQTPVIVDFGLVRTLQETSLTVSWAPRGPGTPLYAPPEQLCNDKALIDWRADQFSLGVSLAMATLGRHPYHDKDGDSASDIVGRVAARAAVPHGFVQAVTSAHFPALAKMVQPWPVERYRTPSELVGAWRAQRDGR